jgi:RND family efflux transporter MFP subunit
VDVYPVEARRTEYTVLAPGTVDAFERVQVTARVAGAVDKVAFAEGQEVKKGEVLVVIDSARFNSAANSAKAALDKALAAQKDAEAQALRREQNPGLFSGEELMSFRTRELTAKADMAVAREVLNSAQLNLRDANVRAPIGGVIQTRTVETGQYVQPGYVMATLLRRDPMLLRFQVAPLDAPRIKSGMVASFKLRETPQEFQAKITLVAGASDEETRMVSVTAEVILDGRDYWLRPGSFCDVTLAVGGARDVVMIPRAAVRPTERGFVGYVIENETARERVLELGANTRDGWVEVREGLKPGDRLVIQGAEPLSEGAKVRVAEVPPPVSAAFMPPRGATSGEGNAAPAAPPSASTAPAPAPGSKRR